MLCRQLPNIPISKPRKTFSKQKPNQTRTGSPPLVAFRDAMYLVDPSLALQNVPRTHEDSTKPRSCRGRGAVTRRASGSSTPPAGVPVASPNRHVSPAAFFRHFEGDRREAGVLGLVSCHLSFRLRRHHALGERGGWVWGQTTTTSVTCLNGCRIMLLDHASHHAVSAPGKRRSCWLECEAFPDVVARWPNPASGLHRTFYASNVSVRIPRTRADAAWVSC